MNDPIKDVIEAIKRCPEVRTASERGWLKASFLNNAGEVFEVNGFTTTRQHMLGKKSRGMRGEADAVLAALQCMESCPAIQQRRSIGRTIIKTLDVLYGGRPQRRPEGRT